MTRKTKHEKNDPKGLGFDSFVNQKGSDRVCDSSQSKIYIPNKKEQLLLSRLNSLETILIVKWINEDLKDNLEKTNEVLTQ